MRRLLHFLLALTVIWCGSHLCETAAVAAPGGAVSLRLDAHVVPEEDGDAEGGRGKLAHGGHHHCPVAVEREAVAAYAPVAPGGRVFASRAPRLTSLRPAPALEPPAA